MIGKLMVENFDPQIGHKVWVHPHYFVSSDVLGGDAGYRVSSEKVLGIVRYTSTWSKYKHKHYVVELLEDSAHRGWEKGDTIRVMLNQMESVSPTEELELAEKVR